MNWNAIADPTAGCVLELLSRAEPPTAEEREAEVRSRQARIRRNLDRLHGFLQDPAWDEYTTGVVLVRLMAELVDGSKTSPAELHEFMRATFDGKKNAFRPHRVSRYVKARHGVGITNHTVKKMLGRLADAGRAGAAVEDGRGGPGGDGRDRGAGSPAATGDGRGEGMRPSSRPSSFTAGDGGGQRWAGSSRHVRLSRRARPGPG